MKRKVIAFGRHYKDFISSLTEKEALKVEYILSLLEIEKAIKIKEEYYEYKRQHAD